MISVLSTPLKFQIKEKKLLFFSRNELMAIGKRFVGEKLNPYLTLPIYQIRDRWANIEMYEMKLSILPKDRIFLSFWSGCWVFNIHLYSFKPECTYEVFWVKMGFLQLPWS